MDAQSHQGQFKMTLLSPERRLLESTWVTSVVLPTSEGEIEILPGHAAMIGKIDNGLFVVRRENGVTDQGVLTSGFFEVSGDNVRVFAETVELKGEVDLSRARNAQKKAEEALSAAQVDESTFNKYQLKLQRSIVRQQFAGRQ